MGERGSPGPSWAAIFSSALENNEREFRRGGYRVYLPRYRKLVRPHGRDRRSATILAPLFPIIFAQDWRGFPQHVQISGEPRVMQAYRGGPPAKISDADVAIIRDNEHAGLFDDIAYPVGPGMGPIVRDDLLTGSMVEGDYLGVRIMGALEGMTDKGKAFVRTVMGRVEIDADTLDLVAS